MIVRNNRIEPISFSYLGSNGRKTVRVLGRSSVFVEDVVTVLSNKEIENKWLEIVEDKEEKEKKRFLKAQNDIEKYINNF